MGTAVQGGDHRVADQVLGEGQHGGHLVARQLHPHAEEADVRHPLEEAVQALDRRVVHRLNPAD
jgi:hypothetical protein